MKKVLLGMMAGLFLLSQAAPLMADEKTFTISAEVPRASAVTFTATQLEEGVDPVNITGTTLSFGTLAFNAENSIWLPAHYFALGVSPQGVGDMNVTVDYSQTTADNPNSGDGGNGLGHKATATFFTVSGTTESPLTAHGPKKRLIDLTGESITAAQLAGGYLKMYVGIVTKDATATYPDPDNSEPFTAGDAPGTYQGTLKITATVS